VSNIKERARAQFSQQRSVYVPEWEATIFWKPITGKDQEKIARAVKAKGSGSDAEYAYRLLIEKVEDENGAKLWDIGDLEDLRTNYDAMIIARIVGVMTQSLTVEQAEKN
jgi:hypothetical protein